MGLTEETLLMSAVSWHRQNPMCHRLVASHRVEDDGCVVDREPDESALMMERGLYMHGVVSCISSRVAVSPMSFSVWKISGYLFVSDASGG